MFEGRIYKCLLDILLLLSRASLDPQVGALRHPKSSI
jgi:hypothetical protein